MKKSKYYSGRYRVVNKQKYEGDYNAVSYRSLWERQVFKWCDENNVICNIVTDPIITRNKLVNIDVWHSIDGNLYDDGYEDYGNQYLDFRSIKQNVVYVEVKL